MVSVCYNLQVLWPINYKIIVLVVFWDSRYDHFATLCEMLPVSLPSLALCLRVWINNGLSVQDVQHVARTLGFSNSCLLGMELLPRYNPFMKINK